MTSFKAKLGRLVSLGKITENEYRNFLLRGIQYQKFGSKYPCLQEVFPDGIPVGASESFIDELEFPYQETSYVCASAGITYPRTYLYKTDKTDGGVTDLAGGKRPIGDNLFASLSRIIVGAHAILVSADNLMANSNQIWDWNFFADNLKTNYNELYAETADFAQQNSSSDPIQVILARKKSTFERLDFLDAYKKDKIAIFNSKKVVILTNLEGYEHISKGMDGVEFISKTKPNGDIDIKECLKQLRKEFDIKKILNDGGRKMSCGMKCLGLLGGERISYEPYPGDNFLPNQVTNEMILGKDESGIDGSPIPNSIVAFSQKINIEQEEQLNLHLYPMQNF